ncbi:hypothetical protein [Xylanibacter brevis]|uniref:hypothetical protein n=1 Tax=Xylanibacter brevis TaxID=83231 RepID=UPI00048A3FBE|nr:hypothetical protein [Xylanibacter brevis]
MKNLFYALLASLMLTSCMTPFYQVYTVKSENLTQKENTLAFENEDCEVLYNLWSEKGSVSFVFKNKTDKDIFIDMTQTFFIKDGEAHDYYLNRTFTNQSFSSVNVGYSYSVSNAYAVAGKWWPNQYSSVASSLFGIGLNAEKKNGFSSGVETKEQEVICIPAHSFKYIGGYSICEKPSSTCDNKIDYPSKTAVFADYSLSTTPLTFKNRIAYSFDKRPAPLTFIENSFWLESVKNYSENAATELVKDETKCASEFSPKKRVFKIGGPNQFYLVYRR